MTPALPELVALSEKATPGPWDLGRGVQNEPVTNIYCDDALGSIVATVAHNYNVAIPRTQEVANAAFIAALVNWFRANHEALATQPARDSGLGEDARNAELRAISAEMRSRLVNNGKHTSPTLVAWAERIDAALAIPSEGEGA